MNARLAVSLVLCASSAFTQTGSTVEGRVLSTVQNQPVSKAVVIMRVDLGAAQASRAGRGGGGGPVADVWVCETGSDGRYKLVNIPPGNYTLRASHNGFGAPSVGRFATAADVPAVKVEAGKNVAAADIHLTPTAAVSGRVLDNDGDPVRGGNVQLMSYQWMQGKKQLQSRDAAQIDDRGEYRIHNVPPGSYYVRAFPNDARRGPRMFPAASGGLALGLTSAFYPDTTDVARATELYLSPGAELNNIDIRVEPISLHSIHGSYPYDPDTNVQVRAVGQNGEGMNMFGDMSFVSVAMMNDVSTIVNGAIGSAIMSANNPQRRNPGTFVINDLAPGTYTLLATANTANKGGGRGQPQPPQITQYARQTVQVLDRDVEGVVLTFTPAVHITGTLQMEGEQPKEGVNPIFLTSDEPAGFGGQPQARPKPDGTLEWTAAPGKYRLRWANGQSGYIKSVKVGDKEMADKTIDTSALDGPVKIVASTVFGEVSGTVTDADGKPVYNADVTFIPDQKREDWTDSFRNAVTDTQGHFHTPTLVPGEYRVYAWVGVENGAPQSEEFRKPFESQAVALKIGAGEKASLDLKAIH